jgi:predicted MFS family arabinose efflux permease
MSSLSDIYGRRSILLLALSFFTLGSIIGAVAQNIATLLAGRALQGIGGGGIIPLSMIVMTDIFPLRQRPKYASLIQLSVAFGTILGPVVGGIFAQYAEGHGGWRWVFYINFPFCAAAYPMLFFYLNLKRKGDDIPHVDWIGAALFIASVLSFLIGISWGGVQYSWSSFQTLLPLCLGIAGLVGTIVYERYGASSPFLRLSILRNPSSIAVYIGSVVQGILVSPPLLALRIPLPHRADSMSRAYLLHQLFGALYYISVYLQAVQALSPTITGVGILPVSAMMMPSSVIVAILISKLGTYRWALWIGWAITVTATGLLILFYVNTSTGEWVGIMLVLGLGHGVLFNSLLFAAQAVSPPKDVAYAASLYTFMRTVGFAIGVVVGSTVFQNMMSKALQNYGLPTELAANAEGYISTLKTLPASAQKDLILKAYAQGLQGVFEVLTGIGGLGIIATVFIPHRSMDRPLESDHTLNSTPKAE